MTSMLLHEQIADLCDRLKLQAVADQYVDWAQQAASKEDSYVDFLVRILKAEHEARQARSRQVLVKMSGFPTIKTLDDYDYTFAVGAPKKTIQALADLAFIERKENTDDPQCNHTEAGQGHHDRRSGLRDRRHHGP